MCSKNLCIKISELGFLEEACFSGIELQMKGGEFAFCSCGDLLFVCWFGSEDFFNENMLVVST